MKQLYILLFTISCLLCYSQELQYEVFVNVDSTITKTSLYNIARTWASQNFNTNNKVTTEDPELGEISGIGNYDYRASKKYMGSSCVEGPISYKFSLFFKDGKYKYSFYSFVHNGSRGPGCGRVDYGPLTVSDHAPLKGKMIADDYAWYDVKEKTSELINSLVKSLNETLIKVNQSNSNW
ncbi:Uncharacterised protein [Chryseobacterium nakagawai]|uniref:DUF4468 domain-containing protein n=1 Tax=Chryseobacterium nakagawai TaxID=1241982 RepID=A0AAD1DQX2_CHRNA|nr:DUF4468 domain-containing protein [Chryseobacterium nakagawai]AZA91191.1 DUF4468 domain-containing protein [Chryseobacterium nakagawai]VEH22757.1 Uncharacterised protein [Chryseobacterium nakagawai]